MLIVVASPFRLLYVSRKGEKRLEVGTERCLAFQDVLGADYCKKCLFLRILLKRRFNREKAYIFIVILHQSSVVTTTGSCCHDNPM